LRIISNISARNFHFFLYIIPSSYTYVKGKLTIYAGPARETLHTPNSLQSIYCRIAYSARRPQTHPDTGQLDRLNGRQYMRIDSFQTKILHSSVPRLRHLPSFHRTGRELMYVPYMRRGLEQKPNRTKGQRHTIANAEECCQSRMRKCMSSLVCNTTITGVSDRL